MRRLQRNERFRKMSLLAQLSQVDSEDLSYVAIPMASDGMTCKLSVFQVSVSQVLAYLKSTFPGARQVSLRNCVACELHVTLTQQPSNIAYMRQVCKIALFSVNYPGIGIG